MYIKWVRKIIHMQIQFSQNRPHVSTLIWQFSLTSPFLVLCLQDWTGIQRHEGWPHGADEWSSLPLPQQALTCHRKKINHLILPFYRIHMALVLPFTHSDKAFLTYYCPFNLYCIILSKPFCLVVMLQLVYVDKKAQTGLSICLQWTICRLSVPMGKDPLLGKSFLQIN